MLGPYNGRPACLSISISPSRGVCGNSFTSNTTLVVPDVEAYPGHIGMSTLVFRILRIFSLIIPSLSRGRNLGDEGGDV